jgi:hypothetical protein
MPALNWRRVSFKCLRPMADLPIVLRAHVRSSFVHVLRRPRAEIGGLKSGELLDLKWADPETRSGP